MATELRSLRYGINPGVYVLYTPLRFRYVYPLRIASILFTGTVTASPSPLGLSLTPPPTLGGSLGGLVGGASRVSAAPGAEAKFRASAVPALTANGVFGSSSSLFPNLVGKPGRGGTTSIGDKNAGGRSRLLEDFRNNRYE